MDSNISELVKLGHERADELKASCGAVNVRSVAQLISDLASQLEVQYVRAEESQREFRSADITMQNLEAKCAALAADNAGLKGALNKITFTYPLSPHIHGMTTIQTPATDAFLAEVRAQGVDMFALMFAEEAIKSNNITTGWRAKASRSASEYAEALREDAAQIRKVDAHACPHCGGVGTCSAHGCTATDQMLETYRASKGKGDAL